MERFTGEGRQEQYAALARKVVDIAPDAILSMHARIALPLKSLTSTIPIIAVNSDPVALGLVTNLARPGGNITGEIWGKRLDVLRDDACNAASRAHAAMDRAKVLADEKKWTMKVYGVVSIVSNLSMIGVTLGAGAPFAAISTVGGGLLLTLRSDIKNPPDHPPR